MFENFLQVFFNKLTEWVKAVKIHCFCFFCPHQKEKETKEQFPCYHTKTYTSWPDTACDLWYSSKRASYFRDLKNICHHSDWGAPQEKKKKISSFFSCFASFKIALCSSVSWQRNLCFGCTSVRGLLNKHRASSLYTPREMKFSIPSYRTSSAKPPQGGKTPDFSLRGFKKLKFSTIGVSFNALAGWSQQGWVENGECYKVRFLSHLLQSPLAWREQDRKLG